MGLSAVLHVAMLGLGRAQRVCGIVAADSHVGVVPTDVRPDAQAYKLDDMIAAAVGAAHRGRRPRWLGAVHTWR